MNDVDRIRFRRPTSFNELISRRITNSRRAPTAANMNGSAHSIADGVGDDVTGHVLLALNQYSIALLRLSVC